MTRQFRKRRMALVLWIAGTLMMEPSGGQENPAPAGPGASDQLCAAAVDTAISRLTNYEQLWLQSRAEDELWRYAVELGEGRWNARVEDYFSLSTNKPLIRSCLGDAPEAERAISFEILKRAWKTLQASEISFEGIELVVSVRDIDGWFMPSALVTVCRQSADAGECVSRMAGANGEATVELNALDSYRIVVSLDGFVSAGLEVDLSQFWVPTEPAIVVLNQAREY